MGIQKRVERRTQSRTRVFMTATLILADGPRHVVVRDLSANGAQINDSGTISAGQDACLVKGRIFVAARVAWSRKGVAGLHFYRQLNAAEMQRALPSAGFDEIDV
jgi:hypothetical protein